MERLQIPSRAHAQLPHVQDLTSTLAIHEQDFYLFFFFFLFLQCLFLAIKMSIVQIKSVQAALCERPVYFKHASERAPRRRQ